MKKKNKILKTRDDFLKFFRSIPKSKWTTIGLFEGGHGRYCAFGHVHKHDGDDNGPSTRNLRNLLSHRSTLLTETNDKRSELFPQRSAKARVLALVKQLA